MFTTANGHCARVGLSTSSHAHQLRHSFSVITLELLMRGHIASLGSAIDLPPTSAETIARLRREKEDGLRTITLYAERIRQLSVENHELQAKIQRLEGVTVLRTRRPKQS